MRVIKIFSTLFLRSESGWMRSSEIYQNDLECLRNMSGIIHKIARDLGIISCFGRTETVDEIVDCIEDLTTRINDHLEAIEQRISD